MARKMFKYEVPIRLGGTAVEMSASAVIKHVAAQGDVVAMWCEVNDPSALFVLRKFHTYVTGAEIPAHLHYVGTALFDEGRFVAHLHEDKNAKIILTPAERKHRG